MQGRNRGGMAQLTHGELIWVGIATRYTLTKDRFEATPELSVLIILDFLFSDYLYKSLKSGQT